MRRLAKNSPVRGRTRELSELDDCERVKCEWVRVFRRRRRNDESGHTNGDWYSCSCRWVARLRAIIMAPIYRSVRRDLQTGQEKRRGERGSKGRVPDYCSVSVVIDLS